MTNLVEFPRLGPSHWLRANARHTPDRAAIVDGLSSEALTFGEVDHRVDRLCNALRGARLEPGDRVAVLATDCHGYLETALASFRTGIAFVPLNVRLTADDLARQVQRTGCRLLFTQERYLEIARELVDRCPSLTEVLAYDAGTSRTYETFLAEASDAVFDRDPHPEMPVMVAFTSGTTGDPKGVLRSGRMISTGVTYNLVTIGATREDFRYTASPMYHAASLTLNLIGTALGFPVLVLPQFDAQQLLPWMRDRGLTGAFMVPTMLSTLLRTKGVDADGYGGLRSIVYGAAPITAPLLRRAMETFDCDFVQLFGAGTETGLQCSLSSADHRRALAGSEHLLSSIGRPVFGVELKLCDENGAEVAQGELGEITTRSDQLMSGYLDGADAFDDAVRNRWFRAGDLARADDEGYLYLAGRRKDLIIRGGVNIAPIEIESVLSELPEILEVAVVGVPDEHWGEVIHAVVVANDADPEQLLAHCRSRLPSSKVPVRIHLVSALPKNASGKVVKWQIRDDLTAAHRSEPDTTPSRERPPDGSADNESENP